MRWYKSATLKCNVVNTYTESATIPKFCTFTTENGEITYCTFDQYELKSNTKNTGDEEIIELIQGIPVTPVRITSNPYPDVGKDWHTIYGYNYTAEDVVNNRIYLKHQSIDQDHIILIDDTGSTWELKKNVYLTTDVGRFFEFNVDVNDQPYLELVDYWGNFNVNKFKIFYIRSSGEDGQLNGNTLKRITGNIWSRIGTGTSQSVYNVSSFIKFTHFESTKGYYPETADEARKNSVMYQNTLDTLITLADYERATLRLNGVANVRATDLTNDPGKMVTAYKGDINKDGIIDILDVELLEKYLAGTEVLTGYQKKLAMVSGGTDVSIADLNCLKAYLDGDYTQSGSTGLEKVTDIELLDGFVVKLYILRTDAKDSDDETEMTNFASTVISELAEYKALPIEIEVDLTSIQKYFWSIQGTFYTTQPLTRDELQTIIVNINNTLRYKYALEKINFNTLVNYREIIDTIMGIDSRILMVDLDPIKYVDEDGKEVAKNTITGKYTKTIPLLENEDDSQNIHYKFKLDETTILPGSVLISYNDGEITLKDNNNGDIPNIDNVLQHKGSINYVTGEIDLEFTGPLGVELKVSYTKNVTNVAAYRNLSTQEFFFDASSLRNDEIKTNN